MIVPIRSVIRTKSGQRLCVIDLLPRSGHTVLIDKTSRTAQPSIWESAKVAEMLSSGEWGIELSNKQAAHQTGKQSIRSDAFQTSRWDAIQPLLFDEQLYRRETRQRAIDLAHNRTGMSTVFLRATLRKAWQGGMTASALRTDLDKCGRSKVDGKARGRKPTVVEYEIYQWDMKLRPKVVRYAVRQYKMVLATHESVHDKVMWKFYSRRLDGDGGELELLPPGEAPSVRQIRTILDAIPKEEIIKARLSKATFDNDYRCLIGRPMDDCLGPGHTYEIDASQIDHWVLSRERGNVKHVIGKAVLYLLVCRFSRLICGWFVSLDPPSWTGAMQAILSLFQNKKEMCDLHGEKYDPANWPADGFMPSRFFADRGSEFTGLNSDLIVDRLGTTVTNARSMWAASKGLVEVSFKLLHVQLKAMNAGYDPAYTRRLRRATKFHKRAKLTLVQLRRKIFKAIVKHNRSSHLRYELHPDDIRDGLQPIPQEVFARAMARYGRPRTFDEEEVRFQLLPEDDGVVHQEGIWFQGAMYTCEATQRLGWHTKAAGDNPYVVRVRHLPGIVDAIYVIDTRHPANYYVAKLKSSHEAYRGMSRYELLNLEGIHKENEFWGKRHNQTIRVNSLDEHQKDGLFDKCAPAIKSKDITALRDADRRADRSETLMLPPQNEREPHERQTTQPDGVSAVPIAAIPLCRPNDEGQPALARPEVVEDSPRPPATPRPASFTVTGLAARATDRIAARLQRTNYGKS